MDPLGFGRSKNAEWSSGEVQESHLSAIDLTLRSLGLAGQPTVAVGHSFGANLALRWAARSHDAWGVVAISTPLFTSRREADERISQMGWLESLLASGPVAERLCKWMCAHPGAASVAAVALSPRLPTAVAAASIQHSWRTYIANLDGIVRDAGWRSAVQELNQKSVPVVFLYGTDDAVRVPGRVEKIAADARNVRLCVVDGGHQLPLSNPHACVDEIRHMLHQTGLGAP